MADLSVIIISPDGFLAIDRLLEMLRRQTARKRMELLFVFPEGVEAQPDASLAEDFEHFRLLTVENMNLTSVARAIGIRAARAPVVVLTEDHSMPEPEWAERLIEAHRGPWAAVGPVVKNGNPDSVISWANFVIEYGEWMYPRKSGEAEHVPGHNSSYKREVLMSYDADLESWLEAESVLHWDMRSKGHRLAIDSGAVTRHHNFSVWGSSLELRFNAGRQFAGMCGERWSPARRLLYFFGSPLIPFVRTWRLIRQMRMPGRPSELLPKLALVSFCLLCVETLGAAIGFVAGPGETGRYIARIDFHREDHMNADDRQRYEG